MIFCDVDMTDYTHRNCGIDFAGVVGIALIDIYESPTQTQLELVEFWTSKLTESPRKYHVIRNTRGAYQDAEPNYEDDLVGFLVTGVNHQATIDVPEVKENRDFWEAVKRKNWKLCMVTSGGLLYYIDSPVAVIPSINNPRNVKSAPFFQVQLKWMALKNPYVFEAPEGLFYGTIPEEADVEGIFDYTFDDTFQ